MSAHMHHLELGAWDRRADGSLHCLMSPYRMAGHNNPALVNTKYSPEPLTLTLTILALAQPGYPRW